MIKQHSYEAYKQQSVMTMTQAEMLTMLYDGILKEIFLVKKAFEQDPLDIAEINRILQKTQKIVNYLKNSLDTNYDIANNLYSLYDYCNWILMQTNIKKDPSQLDEIVVIVGDLKESYILADKSMRMQTQAPAQQHVHIG
ncbi:MAG: flagellar export chaperone FliS [Clostridiales bacterium]|nr:flagellar export chaperone FliS [Clostridiales bacterium]